MTRENHLPAGQPMVYTKTETSPVTQTTPYEIQYAHWAVFHKLTKILMFLTGGDDKRSWKKAVDFVFRHPRTHSKRYVRQGEPVHVGRGERRIHGVNDGTTHRRGEP